MYKIASPLMISSDRVAAGLFQIVHSDKWSDGKMMDRKGKVINLKNYDSEQKKAFWNQVEMQIDEFLRRENFS